MIRDVIPTGVLVNDQEAALEFYTNKLGLEKIQDEPYGAAEVPTPAGSRSRPQERRSESSWRRPSRITKGPWSGDRMSAGSDAEHRRHPCGLRGVAGERRAVCRRASPLQNISRTETRRTPSMELGM